MTSFNCFLSEASRGVRGVVINPMGEQFLFFRNCLCKRWNSTSSKSPSVLPISGPANLFPTYKPHRFSHCVMSDVPERCMPAITRTFDILSFYFWETLFGNSKDQK